MSQIFILVHVISYCVGSVAILCMITFTKGLYMLLRNIWKSLGWNSMSVTPLVGQLWNRASITILLPNISFLSTEISYSIALTLMFQKWVGKKQYRSAYYTYSVWLREVPPGSDEKYIMITKTSELTIVRDLSSHNCKKHNIEWLVAHICMAFKKKIDIHVF